MTDDRNHQPRHTLIHDRLAQAERDLYDDFADPVNSIDRRLMSLEQLLAHYADMLAEHNEHRRRIEDLEYHIDRLESLIIQLQDRNR